MNTTLALPKRDTDHERVLGIVFDTSPAQASVISCLCRSTIVSSKELLKYTGTKSHIKVAVSRARQKLQAHGLDIKSRIGVGYWIEAEDRHRIETIVEAFIRS